MEITKIIPTHPEVEVAELLTEQHRRIAQQAQQLAGLQAELASADAYGTQRWKDLQESRTHAEHLQQQVQKLGLQNIALAAEAEGRALAEQQLAAADKRIKELEAALVLASLPQDSRDNVIQMARAA